MTAALQVRSSATVPADPTARSKGWVGRNCWVMAANWKRPRMILLVRAGLVYFARVDKNGGRAGSYSRETLPADVHEVEPPTDQRPLPRSLS